MECNEGVLQRYINRSHKEISIAVLSTMYYNLLKAYSPRNPLSGFLCLAIRVNLNTLYTVSFFFTKEIHPILFKGNCR